MNPFTPACWALASVFDSWWRAILVALLFASLGGACLLIGVINRLIRPNKRGNRKRPVTLYCGRLRLPRKRVAR